MRTMSICIGPPILFYALGLSKHYVKISVKLEQLIPKSRRSKGSKGSKSSSTSDGRRLSSSKVVLVLHDPLHTSVLRALMTICTVIIWNWDLIPLLALLVDSWAVGTLDTWCTAVLRVMWTSTRRARFSVSAHSLAMPKAIALVTAYHSDITLDRTRWETNTHLLQFH